MYFTIPENCLHTEAGGGSRPLFLSCWRIILIEEKSITPFSMGELACRLKIRTAFPDAAAKMNITEFDLNERHESRIRVFSFLYKTIYFRRSTD